jgi:hypothetical protein
MPLLVLKVWLAVLALVSLTGASCVRNQQPKKDGAFLDDPAGPTGTVATSGPSRARVTGQQQDLVQPPAPPGGAIQPPRSELMAGAVPPLPGMPGSASRPQPESDVPPDITLASFDDDKKGPIRRLIQDIRDKRAQPPQLPPAVDPKKEPEPKKEPPKPMPVPVVPDQTPVKPAQPAPAKPASPLAEARKMVETAAKSYAETTDFTARLTKRDVVGGKPQPQEEVEYAFRKEPLSIHMKVVGENGTGREVMYVKGRNDGKLTFVTGKGDLFGAGIKRDMDPDSPLVTGRSRTRIYEAGFARPIGVLTKMLDQADAGKRPADTIKFLGPVSRKDVPGSLVGIEVTFLTGEEPLMPKGGVRSYFFDMDPKSAAFGLPVLITATEAGKEVEYYAFTKLQRPAGLTDADFNPDKLGKKR